MKNNSTNQEILLMSNCSFFNRDWVELNGRKIDKQLSQKEQLIQLCWNGMLTKIMPEIMEITSDKKNLTLWEINQSGNMLDLRYGDLNQLTDDEWSINPYVFRELAIMN